MSIDSSASNLNSSSDRRLDIVVLGPISEHADPTASTAPIRNAVAALLREPDFDALLTRAGVAVPDRHVHIPDEILDPEIVHGILMRLDTADLVLINLTPKAGRDETSPNVFYELALVHALGIPAILVKASGKVPFYATGMRQVRVEDFELSTLMTALREPLHEFIDAENTHTNFANNRVTLFYGLPIVDISAAAGLATSYYQNFLSRLLVEGGFLAAYPDLIRQVVVVRPSGVDSTYPADIALLRKALAGAGFELATEKLSPPATDTLGQLWFDHVGGIVLDIPRAIYPLRQSQRLLSFQQRHQTFPGPAAKRAFTQRYRQIWEQLLNQVESAIQHQMRYDARSVRSHIPHFTTIGAAPDLVARLRGQR